MKKYKSAPRPPTYKAVSFCPSRPDCIINDNHAYLLEFLDGLSPPERSVTIQDWETAGRVYLDYIRVIQSLQDIQQVRTPSPRRGRRGPLCSGTTVR